MGVICRIVGGPVGPLDHHIATAREPPPFLEFAEAGGATGWRCVDDEGDRAGVVTVRYDLVPGAHGGGDGVPAVAYYRPAWGTLCRRQVGSSTRPPTAR